MDWKKYFFLNVFGFVFNIATCGALWAILAYYKVELDFVVMISSACLMSMLMNLFWART
jgi:hypothetical protein